MGIEGYRSLYGDLTRLKDASLLDNPAGGSGADARCSACCWRRRRRRTATATATSTR